jgi:hypothetical protein
MAPRSPQEQVISLILGVPQGRCLAAAAELCVADALASGPLPVEELADRINAHAGNLFRLLRAMETIGVFQQVSPGVFANSR